MAAISSLGGSSQLPSTRETTAATTDPLIDNKAKVADEKKPTDSVSVTDEARGTPLSNTPDLKAIEQTFSGKEAQSARAASDEKAADPAKQKIEELRKLQEQLKLLQAEQQQAQQKGDTQKAKELGQQIEALQQKINAAQGKQAGAQPEQSGGVQPNGGVQPGGNGAQAPTLTPQSSGVASPGGGGGGVPSGSGAGNPGGQVGGANSAGAGQQASNQEVQQFLNQAASAYGADPGVLTEIARRESNFNTGDIANNWDSNAKKGTPSKGMFQFIEPTFSSMAPQAQKANPQAWQGVTPNWTDWKAQALTCAWALSNGKGSHWSTYQASLASASGGRTGGQTRMA